MIHIVTDAAADMPPEWEQDFNIKIIPLFVRFGNQEYQSGKNLPAALFYQLVKIQKMLPKTSLPSPHQIIEFYSSFASKGDTILSIHLASKMSGTFSAVQMAARELAEEYRIFPLDSGAGSAALGFLCREARLWERMGVSAQTIVDRLEVLKTKVNVIFTLDTLEFAYMSGRITAMQNALSSMLKIKPIIILKDGLLQMGEKVRTRQRALEQVLEDVSQRIGKEMVNVAVVHAGDPEAARELVERVKARFNICEVIVTELAIPVAANLGPGTVGLVTIPANPNCQGSML